MIFQRRFHSHTPTTIDTPPTPPPKDLPSPPKTLGEVLAITVSPRAPQSPPHAAGTVASKLRHSKSTPLRSASSPLKNSLTVGAPISRKTGYATIHTEGADGHESFESDAFDVHMPTTRIPIIDAPILQSKPTLPTNNQMEAVHTYEQKAKQARERNDSIGVCVPPNIASYDYAYANTVEATTAIPAVLKPSSGPPAPLGAFPASPLLQQRDRAKSGPRAAHTVATSSISSNTSVYRKPTVLGVATAAAVIEESVQFVRVDSKGGASRLTTPPKSTTVKISMNKKTQPPAKARTAPAVKMKIVLKEAGQTQLRDVKHHRGLYYRTTHDKSATPSRSPSPTKSMPNFTRQYSIDGDSIFGYKVKDPLGAIAGASTLVSSSSDDEKPKASTNKPQNFSRQSSPKRTIADRWPWIRKGAATGKSPSAPTPYPPVRAPTPRRPLSTYKSPFESFDSRFTTTGIRSATPGTLSTRMTANENKHASQQDAAASTASAISMVIETGLQQAQSYFLLALEVCLALYLVVSLWFILDAVREALFVVSVPLQFVVMLIWAIMGFLGRILGKAAKTLGGKVRILGR
ncbi:hypothetical protein B5807_07548 [Epicoccum nigrum]|uniref:Uncharacterized protein n=1 Tax=Epicoccum nigrum TaxID=105696 RepID=A0A1Y2LUL3_EPING|nr:hypothetical protein B5807_07548 [Epicoccum nigrum]